MGSDMEQKMQTRYEQAEPETLSERLSASTVEEARPLLEELLWAVEREPISHLISDRGNKYLNLLDIGPEGYLSAVVMLLPEGWWADTSIGMEEYGGSDVTMHCPTKYSYIKKSASHPALALAAAIAKTLEIDDAV